MLVRTAKCMIVMGMRSFARLALVQHYIDSLCISRYYLVPGSIHSLEMGHAAQAISGFKWNPVFSMDRSMRKGPRAKFEYFV